MDPVKLFALVIVIWMAIELIYHCRAEIGWVLQRIADAWRVSRFFWDQGERWWKLGTGIISLLLKLSKAEKTQNKKVR